MGLSNHHSSNNGNVSATVQLKKGREGNVLGCEGEKIAVTHLIEQGFEILRQNVHVRNIDPIIKSQTEIDIIVPGYWIEVKNIDPITLRYPRTIDSLIRQIRAHLKLREIKGVSTQLVWFFVRGIHPLIRHWIESMGVIVREYYLTLPHVTDPNRYLISNRSVLKRLIETNFISISKPRTMYVEESPFFHARGTTLNLSEQTLLDHLIKSGELVIISKVQFQKHQCDPQLVHILFNRRRDIHRLHPIQTITL